MNVLLTFTVIIGIASQAKADCDCSQGRGTMLDIHVRKWISKDKCDISSPGLLALELLTSKLDSLTIGDLDHRYKEKGVSPQPPSEFNSQEMEKIHRRVMADMCDYTESRCTHGHSCIKKNCETEHMKMLLAFQMCAKNLKSFDFAGLTGSQEDNFQQFFNTSIVLTRRYFWRRYNTGKSGMPGSGDSFIDIFIRLVPQKYREALEDSSFPVSIDTDASNVRNKRAAAKCLMIAREEEAQGLSEYEKNGFSTITNDVVEKVFVGLLSGTIAERVLDEHAIRNLEATKLCNSKTSLWKNLGKKLKSMHDLPLCVDPLRAEIGEIRATCQLKNIDLGDSDMSTLKQELQSLLQPNGKVPEIPRPAIIPGHLTHHRHVIHSMPTLHTTRTMPVKTTTAATASYKAVDDANKKGPITAGMSIEPEPVHKGFNVGMGAPQYVSSNYGAPSMIQRSAANAPSQYLSPQYAPR